MTVSDFWARAKGVHLAFVPHYQPGMRAALIKTGIRNDWVLLARMRGLHPQPFTRRHARYLFPATNDAYLDDGLARLEAMRCITRDDDAHLTTVRGREHIGYIYRIAQREMARVETDMPQRDMRRLADLLQHMVRGAVDCVDPTRQWALASSRWSDAGRLGPPAIRIDQYLTDLAMFRFDMGSAVCDMYGLSAAAGMVLETLAVDDAATGKTIHLDLHDPKLPDAVISAVFDELTAMGWLLPATDAPHRLLTATGQAELQALRSEHEAHADVVWDALRPAHQTELLDLLLLLQTALVVPVPLTQPDIPEL
jgi:hypothetical protein